MNTLFGFYFEVWKYIQTPRRDEHWVIEIIEMAEEVQPSWRPDREKLEALDVAYNREIKSENDLKIIKAFVKGAKTDLTDQKNKIIQNILAEICSPAHQQPVLP